MNDFDPDDSKFLKPLRQHFPETCIAFDTLRDVEDDDEASLRRLLVELVDRQAALPPHRNLTKPKVFISHRRGDEKLARRFVHIARRRGFHFWLDVLDPALESATKKPDRDPVRQALTIAILIEMALLNCTHVLVVVTRRTAGSLWVPYEYGRVKCATMLGSEAAAWLNRGLCYSNRYADYLRLGQLHRKQQDVEQWMARELKKWKQRPAQVGLRRRNP